MIVSRMTKKLDHEPTKEELNTFTHDIITQAGGLYVDYGELNTRVIPTGQDYIVMITIEMNKIKFYALMTFYAPYIIYHMSKQEGFKKSCSFVKHIFKKINNMNK